MEKLYQLYSSNVTYGMREVEEERYLDSLKEDWCMNDPDEIKAAMLEQVIKLLATKYTTIPYIMNYYLKIATNDMDIKLNLGNIVKIFVCIQSGALKDIPNRGWENANYSESNFEAIAKYFRDGELTDNSILAQRYKKTIEDYSSEVWNGISLFYDINSESKLHELLNINSRYETVNNTELVLMKDYIDFEKFITMRAGYSGDRNAIKAIEYLTGEPYKTLKGHFIIESPETVNTNKLSLVERLVKYMIADVIPPHLIEAGKPLEDQVESYLEKVGY